MTNYKCIVEYDGARFYGWSKQPERRTVQGEIEKALFSVFKSEISVICAARTDKGVHAAKQTINFKSARFIPAGKLIIRLNSLLTNDVSVKRIQEVPESFDARKCAIEKTYIYRIYNNPIRSSLYRNHFWHISKPLDMEKMKKAASFLTGKKDFAVFDSYNSVFNYKTADLKEIKIIKKGAFADIYVIGDRFLYKMVRKIAGELVRTGQGKQTPEGLREAVIKKDKSKIGKPAPPYGLYLAKIRY